MASAGSRRSQPPTVLSRQSLEIPTSAKAVATAEDRKPRSRTLWEKAAGIARKKRLRSRPPYSRLYTVLFGRVGAHRAAALQKTGCSAYAIGRIFRLIMTFVILINVVSFVVGTMKEVSTKYRVQLDAIEMVSSCIFLIEYFLRVCVCIEHPRYSASGPVYGRLKYMRSSTAIIDAVATFPFFIDLASDVSLDTTAWLRVFRLFSLLKSESFTRSFGSVHRVFVYNSDILVVGFLMCLLMIFATSTVLYYLQPPETNIPGDPYESFQSIPACTYLAILMLTGQGQPDGELPWYTKVIIVATAMFSIALFAIPAGMLTWGFEAEAERLFRKKAETKAYERKVVRAKSLQRVIEELQLKPNAEGAYTAKQLRDEMYTIKMRFDLKGLSTVLIAELIDECDTDADGNVTIDELSRSHLLQATEQEMESSDDELDEDTEDEADAEYEAVVAEDAAAEDDDASTIPTELKKWMVKIEAEQAKHAQKLDGILEILKKLEKRTST